MGATEVKDVENVRLFHEPIAGADPPKPDLETLNRETFTRFYLGIFLDDNRQENNPFMKYFVMFEIVE